MNNPDLILLWHYAFYDHPLTGVATYKGMPVWFSVKEDGGWQDLDTLPEDRSVLSQHELESISTKEEILERFKEASLEIEYDGEGHWCRDGTYTIHKLTDQQFVDLNNYQNESLDYGFKNDHRPEKKDHKPSHTTDEWFKLNKEKTLSFPDLDYTKGEILGEFRWFEFTNWFRK